MMNCNNTLAMTVALQSASKSTCLQQHGSALHMIRGPTRKVAKNTIVSSFNTTDCHAEVNVCRQTNKQCVL